MALKLKRSLNFHITRTFIPSSLFVCLAWASVFIPSHLLPGAPFVVVAFCCLNHCISTLSFLGRVTLGITILLSLASMYSSLNSITPPIAYNTNLDVWIFGCFFLVCSTLLETVTVVALKHWKALDRRSAKVGDKSSKSDGINSSTKTRDEIERLSTKVDRWFALTSFFIFAVFSLVYWVDLLKNEKKADIGS